MVADLLEVTVKGCTLLVPVDGIFGGIYIDDESPFVSAPKEGAGGSLSIFLRAFRPSPVARMLFSNRQSADCPAPLSCSLPKANRSAGSTFR